MNRASFLGLLFIIAGVLVLLVSLDVLQGGFAHLWIISILLVNSCFFVLSRDRLTWGQRIFGFMLLSLGATGVGGEKAGLIALTSASLGFFLSYFFGSKPSWWLLVPAGIFTGLSLYFWLGELLPVWDAVPIMLLIFSGTFTLLYLLPADYGGREWALLPALGLIVLTVVSNDPLERRTTLLIIISLVVVMLVGWWFMRRRRMASSRKAFASSSETSTSGESASQSITNFDDYAGESNTPNDSFDDVHLPLKNTQITTAQASNEQNIHANLEE